MNIIFKFIDNILCKLFDFNPPLFIIALVGIISLTLYQLFIIWCWSVIFINEFIKGI
jgi:hypothetical protein